ncbi:MAG: glutamate--tRNA ligase family protein [Phycisphaerales bacterium]
MACLTPPVYTQSRVCTPHKTGQTPQQPITRLAPSPTGALHLGNARTFFINWALAKQRNWRIVLRIEDLDTPRVKPGVIDQTIKTLEWLGVDWEGEPQIQSSQLASHMEAMQRLARLGHVYPCELSRSQIQLATNAPNEGDHEIRFSPKLRPVEIPERFTEAGTNWRFMVHDQDVEFIDGFLGDQRLNPSQSIGDFVVWTQRQSPSYQLAVVVDDYTQAITHIVRGDDLLDSTARQLLLMDALGYKRTPEFVHLPLVRGSDGRRLAKRHGDTRIDHYIQLGVSTERIIGLLAYWSGIQTTRNEMSAQHFLEGFSLDTLPTTDIVFTPEDDLWLRS